MASRSNAYRRYKENRPAKWWVVIEFFLMGTVAGYYVPLWFGMAVNPHVRTRIDTLMDKMSKNAHLHSFLEAKYYIINNTFGGSRNCN